MRSIFFIFSLFVSLQLLHPTEEELQWDIAASTPEQVGSLESSFLVGGIISPLSGQPVLFKTDLIAHGAQEIRLSRVYTSPQMPCNFPKHKHKQKHHDNIFLYGYLLRNYVGWEYLPHTKLDIFAPRRIARLVDSNGLALDFKFFLDPNQSKTLLSSPTYGISNVQGDVPSAKHDPRNVQISIDESRNWITIRLADGTVRKYFRNEFNVPDILLYQLGKEILPNGKLLRYHYDQKRHLRKIESLDPQERHLYAWLEISGFEELGNCSFLTSDSLNATYTYMNKELSGEFKENVKGGYRHREYHYKCRPALTAVSSPFYRRESLDYTDRFLLDTYLGKNEVFKVQLMGVGSIPYFRTHKLLFPVGDNSTFEPIYEFSYQPPIAGKQVGSTTVKNPDGTSIIYHFSRQLLPTSIDYLSKDGAVKKKKIYKWSEQNWLQSLELIDDAQLSLSRKEFVYDSFGNPIEERLIGDLSGVGVQENHLTQRTFSEDGLLLLREEHENGKVTSYTYLPGTQLLTSKLIQDKDKILLREFWEYDDCNNLIRTLVDDGSGKEKENLSEVTIRKQTSYFLRQNSPFLHMPEWVIESYWEGNDEKLLKKRHLIYDSWGNVSEEEHYDANGSLTYTVYKTYNERGDLLSETNALGQKSLSTYTDKGQLETQQNFSNRLSIKHQYDSRGRLRQIQKEGDDHILHTTRSDYDLQDRLILETDSFGNQTRHSFDPLVNQINHSIFPFINSLEGTPVEVSTSCEYDCLGRAIRKKDANGNTTHFRYNLYGSPTEILYANGSKQTYRYSKGGELLSHTDRDGLTTQYLRNALGQILSKRYFSKENELLAEETFVYKGTTLLSETDKEGHSTYYFYDGAGRKIREETCGKTTTFLYDALGRLSEICKNECLWISYQRDLEGRVLQESRKDASGNLLYQFSYTYDEDGNNRTISQIIDSNEAVETFAYDSFRREIEHRDALGALTLTSYDENFNNALGQRVLQTTQINPLGIRQIWTEDALHRQVKTEQLSQEGVLLSCKEYIHDPQGNLLYRKDPLLLNGTSQNVHILSYTYTEDHQIASMTRAFGTSQARSIRYAYLPSGKLEKKILPDGISLHYTYNPLGFINRIDSSDGIIHHAFSQNKLGHLIKATDEHSQISIHREVDAFGNILSEQFPNGLEIQKAYDYFDRPHTLKLANQGYISLTYDPLYLRRVERYSSEGKLLYFHHYEQYDLSGHLLRERPIGNNDRIQYTLTPLGQIGSLTSPHFSEHSVYDALGNLVENLIDSTPFQYTYDATSQLTEEISPHASIHYVQDSLFNRVEKNDQKYAINLLNELIDSPYDQNGNLLQLDTPHGRAQLRYDPLNRLTEALFDEEKILFTYDPLGRRLSKTLFHKSSSRWEETESEFYLYDGEEEIGAFTSKNQPRNLRVLAPASFYTRSKPISLELNREPFAPLLDVQSNIRRLANLRGYLKASYEYSAFGEVLRHSSIDTPWGFACKRRDPELDLIYFGKRYYIPHLGRWLTTDPAGFIDSINLYQYVLNNPFRYLDPNGEFALMLPLLAWGAELLFPSLTTLAAPVIYSFLAGTVVYGGYKAAQVLSDKIQDFYAPKNTDVYAPDRPLPTDEKPEPKPETDAPHTQLGKQKGRRSTYPQAREFDENGKHVRDIDFTDHDRPANHPNPHQHVYRPNKTGGTPSRSKIGEPVPEWRY